MINTGVRCWECWALHASMISKSPLSRLTGKVNCNTWLHGLITAKIPRIFFRLFSGVSRDLLSSTILSSTMPAARSKNISTISKNGMSLLVASALAFAFEMSRSELEVDGSAVFATRLDEINGFSTLANIFSLFRII